MRLQTRLLCLFALTLAMAGCSAPRTTSPRDNAIGEAALNSGGAETALRLADETLRREPRNADALTRRGMALTALGRLGEARASLAQAVAASPANERALMALGRVQLPVDPAGAAISFEAVLKHSSGNAIALNNLGIARDLLGNHLDAEHAYREAMAIQPDMTAVRVNLALCLAMQGAAEEAVGLLQPIADSPGASRKVKENYAAVLAMTGDREEAQHILSANLPSKDVGPALDVLASARLPGPTLMR